VGLYLFANYFVTIKYAVVSVWFRLLLLKM
jgi:hypothetical protein